MVGGYVWFEMFQLFGWIRCKKRKKQGSKELSPQHIQDNIQWNKLSEFWLAFCTKAAFDELQGGHRFIEIIKSNCGFKRNWFVSLKNRSHKKSFFTQVKWT